MRLLSTLPAIPCIAFLCCACGNNDEGSSETKEKLGMTFGLPLSAPVPGLANQAQSWEYAILLAQEEINDAGGIRGRKLAINVRDTGLDVDKNVEIANEALENAEVPILLNGDGSDPAGGALTVALEKKALLIAAVAAGSNLTDEDTADLCFQLPVPATSAGRAAGELAAHDGYRKAAVIGTDTPSNLETADGFVAAFKEAGGKITYRLQLPTLAPGVSYDGCAADLAAAFDTGPDALFLSTPASPGYDYLKTWDADRGGFSGQWYLDGMLRDQMLLDNVGKIAKGMRGVMAGDEEAVNKLKKRIEEASGVEVTSVSRLGENYDAVYVAALALEQAGTMDVDALRDAIRDVTSPPGEVILPGEFSKALELIAAGKGIDYEGMSGSINFDEDGLVTGSFNWWEVGNGSFVTIGSSAP